MKLVQKHLFKGSRQFELVDNAVNVRIKTPLKEERFSVELEMLNPEPVINEPELDFHSRVRCGPLLSLWLNKPNKAEFDAFVDALKRRALEEYSAFAGIQTTPQGSATNPDDKLPQMGASIQGGSQPSDHPVDADQLGVAIQMLETHLNNDNTQTLIAALKALKAQPEDAVRFGEVLNAFNALGPGQGAVLTYAPYVNRLLAGEGR